MATKTKPASASDLKYLGPMVGLTTDVSNKSYDLLATTILQKMPQSVAQPVHHYGEVVYNPVSNGMMAVTGYVDSSLDTVCNKDGKYRQQLDPYVSRFVEARDLYIKKAEDSLGYIREKVPAVAQGLQEQMQKGITDLKRLANEPLGPEVTKKTESLIGFVDGTYQKLISTPAVKTVLEKTKPASDNLWEKYNAVLHDPVVSTPLYHWTYTKSSDTLEWLQQTPLYSLPKAYLYPWMAPVADPVLKKVTSTDMYKVALNQLQPIKH